MQAINESEFTAKLNALRTTYPNYSTWNGTFEGASQCYGFAHLMGYSVFGTYPSTWSKSTNIANVKVGDIVRYGGEISGHSIFVTGVSGDVITFVDCNGNGNYNGSTKVRSCGIKWDNKTSKSAATLFGYKFSYLRVSPGIDNTNHNPVSGMEIVHKNGAGKLRVRGWVYDPDSPSQALNIHVYIGGPAGTPGVEGNGSIWANQERSDSHSGHGFDQTIPVRNTGTQDVYVYAINVGAGENVLLWNGPVYIPPVPTVTNP